MSVPDFVGWELIRAREECRALGLKVQIQVTRDPKSSQTEQPELMRVVAVRPVSSEEVTLVVSTEQW